ncbi:hypothetical protein BJX61DRAFT_530713 [Aspergillus egyptiacus]|nr:hypothetical protein BJX61DRAFT_530713 [Aspergillus egyptiacus]
MELEALNPMERSPRIKQWSDDMRITLCCLFKYYLKDRSTFQAVFNAIFERDLIEYGFRDGRKVDANRIDTQWYDMRKKGDRLWRKVHLSSFDTEEWLPYLARIEETAASLNLMIVRTNTGSIVPSQAMSWEQPSQLQSSPSRQPHSQSATDHMPHQEGPEVIPQLHIPDREPSVESCLCTAGGKVCFRCHLEGREEVCGKETAALEPVETPLLLYRWWNADSQGVNSKTMFVAGKFANASMAYFGPDTISHAEFNGHFLSHINPRNTTPSPFISTFKSLLAPIHRSLHKKEGASVSIINSTKLRSEVYSAQAFVQKHGIKIGTYRGFGEYLIWGDIPSDAIICTFKITLLLRIAEENPDIGRFLQLDMVAGYTRNRKHLHWEMSKNALSLDKRAGAIVGRLLSILEVPQQYLGTVSEGMAYSWRIKTRRIPWGEFFEGVELGYNGRHAMLSPTLFPTPVHSPADNPTNVGEIVPELDSSSDKDLYSDDSEKDDLADGEDGEPDSNLTASDTSSTLDVHPIREEAEAYAELDGASGTPPADVQDEQCVVIESSDGEINDAGEVDLTDEDPLFQQWRPVDQFAFDRARVRSALG